MKSKTIKSIILFLIAKISFLFIVANKNVDHTSEEVVLLSAVALNNFQDISKQIDFIFSKNIFSKKDLFLLASIIREEAGSSNVTDEERICVGIVALNRCENHPEGFYQCFINQRRQWARNIFNFEDLNESLVLLARQIQQREIENNLIEYCGNFRYFFSPRSMPVAQAPISDADTCRDSDAWHGSDARTLYFRTPQDRYYTCHRRAGFDAWYSSGGGFKYFEGLGYRTIPSFANHNRYNCRFESRHNIRQNFFVFCEDSYRRQDNVF